MEMTVVTPYRTKDLYYSAYLRVAEVPFLGAERQDDGKVVFLFEDQGPSAMRDLKRGYFSGCAKVPAMSFVQMIRAMKALTFSTR
jgi:hypothetical protein